MLYCFCAVLLRSPSSKSNAGAAHLHSLQVSEHARMLSRLARSWERVLQRPVVAGTDDVDPVPSTRLRVERQVHLPASRDEAWGALKHLIPDQQWNDAFQLFGALESIYRCSNIWHSFGAILFCSPPPFSHGWNRLWLCFLQACSDTEDSGCFGEHHTSKCPARHAEPHVVGSCPQEAILI